MLEPTRAYKLRRGDKVTYTLMRKNGSTGVNGETVTQTPSERNGWVTVATESITRMLPANYRVYVERG